MACFAQKKSASEKALNLFSSLDFLLLFDQAKRRQRKDNK
jgi:hypothetical protein